MTCTNDNWPTEYKPGPKRHLHAIGVIASVYNDFESGLFELYHHHLKRKKVPEKVSARLYFHANEEQRIELLKFVFAEYEKHKDARTTINSLCTYFVWCWKSRNSLIHATFIPPLFGFEFGGPEDHLFIAKRLSKKSVERGFATLRLAQLRTIADQIQVGSQCCADLHWYLMRRDTPQAKWPLWLAAGDQQALPEIPKPPKELLLLARPHNPPLPAHLRKSSPRKRR